MADEASSSIIRSRITRGTAYTERQLIKQAELPGCTVTFPEGSRDLTLVCAVASQEVSFFIHLPEQYPFHPPRVACQPSPVGDM